MAKGGCGAHGHGGHGGSHGHASKHELEEESDKSL